MPHDTGEKHQKQAGSSNTVNRAITLLRNITSEGAGGARLIDLSRRCGLPHPTARRILKGLIAERMVVQSTATGRYRLGPLAYELGLFTSYHDDLVAVCRPHLSGLVALTQESVYLLMRSGYDAVCIDRLEGSDPIRVVVLRVGGRRPLGVGPAGMALLANMPDSEIHEFIYRQRITLADFRAKDPDLLWSAVEDTRRRGYATIGQWAESGIDGIGVVVPTCTEPAVAISVMSPRERMNPERAQEVAALALQEVQSICVTSRLFSKTDPL